MDKLGATLSATGLAGAITRIASDRNITREMFNNSGSAAASGAAIALIVFIFLIAISFAVMFFYSLYKIMPTNKGMHVILTLSLGAIWFVPALFYHAYNGYSLCKSRM